MKDKKIYIYTTIIVLIALIIGCLFCFIICRKNTSIKNENIEGKQNSAQKEDDSMFNILYTDANGNISAGKLQSNKLVQSNSVGQLQSYTEAGMISYFAMETPPAGWLVCNGASYSTSVYPDLAAAIGIVYGGSYASGIFNVPELRGIFIRCLNSSDGGTDKNRTLSKIPQESTSVIAYAQGANTPITGFYYPIINKAYSTVRNGELSSEILGNGRATARTNTNSDGSQDGDVSYASIRPKNIAMLACIKT